MTLLAKPPGCMDERKLLALGIDDPSTLQEPRA